MKNDKELKQKNKIIWKAMWAILAVSLTALLGGVLVAAFLIKDETIKLIVIIAVTVLFLIPCFYALKLEISVGSYKCKNCGHKIVPTYFEALFAVHFGTTRYLKCPKCNKRTLCKKDLEDEIEE